MNRYTSWPGVRVVACVAMVGSTICCLVGTLVLAQEPEQVREPVASGFTQRRQSDQTGWIPQQSDGRHTFPNQQTQLPGVALSQRYEPNRRNEPAGEMQKALEILKDEKASEGDKSDAQEKMAEILGAQFDTDLESREQRIEQLETQIDQLRSQIRKRREAKERLIELRIELMVNEAEGLGFPSAWNQNWRTQWPTRMGYYSSPNYTSPQLSVGVPVPPATPSPTLRDRTPEPRTEKRR